MATFNRKKGDSMEGRLGSAGKTHNRNEDKIRKAGATKTDVSAKIAAAKKEMLRNPETKQQLMDYILGKTDVNPLESVNENFKTQLEKVPNLNNTKIVDHETLDSETSEDSE